MAAAAGLCTLAQLHLHQGACHPLVPSCLWSHSVKVAAVAKTSHSSGSQEGDGREGVVPTESVLS